MNGAILILGAGGHAKVLLDALLAGGFAPLGLLDRDATRVGGEVLGCPVLGTDAALDGFDPRETLLVNGLGSTRHAGARAALFMRMREQGYRFLSVIHPAAVVATSASLGQGVQIMAGAVVQAGAVLGDNVILNTGARLDHDCRLGDHAHVAPGATVCGGVRIGPRTHLGSGATVIEGTTIGKDCLIGAGAVVVRDVPDGVTALGMPARWHV